MGLLLVIVAALVVVRVLGHIGPALLISSFLLSFCLSSFLLSFQLLGHRLGGLGIVLLQRLWLHRPHLLQLWEQVGAVIPLEGKGGPGGELVEGEGGGRVDTSTRVVGGEVLTTTLSQEKDQHRGDTADNLDNIYKAGHSLKPVHKY